MVNILIDSISVGIFSSLVYTATDALLKQHYYTLFITGFFKHLFEYIFSLQEYYCHRKYNKRDFYIPFHELLVQCIIEGLLFTVLGQFIGHSRLHIFFIGVILHLAFNILGIHKRFCDRYGG